MRGVAKAAAVGLLSVALAAGVTTAPVYAHGGAAHSAPVAQHHRYDARTVFRGVFFGDGPLAASLPYTRSVPTARRSTAAENTVMDRVEAAHPGLIESTYRAFTSGSLVRTRAAITRGRGAVADAVPAGDQHVVQPLEKAIVYLHVVQIRTLYVFFDANQRRDAPDLDIAAYQVSSALHTSRKG